LKKMNYRKTFIQLNIFNQQTTWHIQFTILGLIFIIY